MRKSFAALVFATLALAQQAAAITFPSLTTIYVGTGVRDTGDGPDVGIATAFQCSNVSGNTAQLRFLVLDKDGTIEGSLTRTVPHATTSGVSTHSTVLFDEDTLLSPGSSIMRGTINIESTESGVFCQAYIADARTTVPDSVVPLDLVRVNPHRDTLE